MTLKEPIGGIYIIAQIMIYLVYLPFLYFPFSLILQIDRGRCSSYSNRISSSTSNATPIRLSSLSLLSYDLHLSILICHPYYIPSLPPPSIHISA
nr:UDP galactose transporter [Hymenolepis microstoma]